MLPAGTLLYMDARLYPLMNTIVFSSFMYTSAHQCTPPGGIVLCMDARFCTSMSSDTHNVLLGTLPYCELITMSGNTYEPNKTTIPKVHSDRICRVCKGICHEGSLRTITKQRNAYYCSESCVKRELRKWFENFFDNSKYYLSQANREEYYESAEYKEHVQEKINALERVDVITL